MAFLQVIVYFVLNFSGLFVFIKIWERLYKPPPVDYTTIPGPKFRGQLETLEAILLPPAEPIRAYSAHRGVLDAFEDFNGFSDGLKAFSEIYGPLFAGFFGPRYVVVLTTDLTIRQLAAFAGNQVLVCPWAFGSVIIGDPFFWKPQSSVSDWRLQIDSNLALRRFVSPDRQANLVLRFPDTGDALFDPSKDFVGGDEDDSHTCNSASEQNLAVFVFDTEIDVNGYRIPAFIPILADLGALNPTNEESSFFTGLNPGLSI